MSGRDSGLFFYMWLSVVPHICFCLFVCLFLLFFPLTFSHLWGKPGRYYNLHLNKDPHSTLAVLPLAFITFASPSPPPINVTSEVGPGSVGSMSQSKPRIAFESWVNSGHNRYPLVPFVSIQKRPQNNSPTFMALQLCVYIFKKNYFKIGLKT